MARDGKKGQVGWVTQIFIRFHRVFPSELSHDSHDLKALKVLKTDDVTNDTSTGGYGRFRGEWVKI